MFEIKVPTKKKKDTLTQTIRFSGDDYDIIQELAEKYDLSFNYIVNQMIKYAIENMKEV